MGTDIYMYAERRVESRWFFCGEVTSDHEVSLPEPLPEGFLSPVAVYHGRNYALFAILAGLRNPAYSAVPYEPIASPRGLPSDLSDTLAAWAARFGSVENASWLSLREIASRFNSEVMMATLRREHAKPYTTVGLGWSRFVGFRDCLRRGSRQCRIRSSKWRSVQASGGIRRDCRRRG
jgi:hypothetical protein